MMQQWMAFITEQKRARTNHARLAETKKKRRDVKQMEGNLKERKENESKTKELVINRIERNQQGREEDIKQQEHNNERLVMNLQINEYIKNRENNSNQQIEQKERRKEGRKEGRKTEQKTERKKEGMEEARTAATNESVKKRITS